MIKKTGDTKKERKPATGNAKPIETSTDAQAAEKATEDAPADGETVTDAPAAEKATEDAPVDGETVTDAPAAEKATEDAPLTGEIATDEQVAEKVTELSDLLVTQIKVELDMMHRLKVEKLFKNTKGEYFTTENFAHLSEGNKRENILIIRKEDLETILKSVE